MVKLGQKLHNLRVQKKMSLEEVSQAIKIKPIFLSAIEKGEYNKLPSPAYAQGFVRNYASYLGLSKAEITALFKREFDDKKAYKVLPDVMVKQEEYPLQRVRFQQSLVIAGIALFLFILYLFFQYRAAFLPPSLQVDSPAPNSTVTKEITVSGKAESNATVYVNNQPVSISSDGTFSKRLTLFPGNTTVSIKATNRFGKETVEQRNIFVK